MVIRVENPYTVLGIPRNASPEAVKRAYFSLIREHSPERDPQGFKRIRLAYDSLRDADKRSQTDLFLLSDPYGEFSVHGPEGSRVAEYEEGKDGSRVAECEEGKDGSRVAECEERKKGREYQREISLKIAIYSLSDLHRIDFSDDFNDIVEGLC
jgi:curved DNA-binding protein CbpA